MTTTAYPVDSTTCPTCQHIGGHAPTCPHACPSWCTDLTGDMARAGGTSGRWGAVDALSLSHGADPAHSIDYTTNDELLYALSGRKDAQLTGAEGGYLLIRFDVDGNDYTRVHVEPRAGWWVTPGTSPADLVRRGADYLTALAEKLEQIEALG